MVFILYYQTDHYTVLLSVHVNLSWVTKVPSKKKIRGITNDTEGKLTQTLAVFCLSSRVAQKREDAVSKEVTRKLSEADNRKMSRKEKDER